MKHFYKCLISALLLVAILLPMGGCRLGDSQDQETNAQGSQESANPSQGSAGQTDDKYSKYSPLLQEVLADPYYDDLYRRYESGELYQENSHFDTGTNLLEAFPYDFLTSKEEDVDGIKNGAILANSELYIIQNEKGFIYDCVMLKYRTTDGEKYMHNYLLQYKITEQELEDLTMLYRNRCFQGPVMFQRLASKQTPKVIADFGITESAYESIIASCNHKNNYIAETLNYNTIESGTILSLTPITFRDREGYDILLYLFGQMGHQPVSSCVVYQVNAKMLEYKSKVTYTNGVMDLEVLNALDPVLISSTPITYYFLYSNFKNFKNFN